MWDNAIDWFVLRGGVYERCELSDSGFYQSEIFLDLWLDPAALLGGDMPRVLQVVKEGIAAPEHAAMVKKLAQTASAKKS